MKSQSVLKVVKFIICFTILMFSVSCSSSKPDITAINFLNAIKDGDLSKGKAYLINNDSTLEFDNERNKNVVIKVFSMMKCDIISTNMNGDSAIVKVKVTTPDMGKITLKVVNDVMTKVAEMSENGERIETSYSEKIAEQYFNQELSDPKVQMTTSDVDINLKKENSKWLINGDKKFKNVIRGNMIKSTGE